MASECQATNGSNNAYGCSTSAILATTGDGLESCGSCVIYASNIQVMYFPPTSTANASENMCTPTMPAGGVYDPCANQTTSHATQGEDKMDMLQSA
jgi:hypothetical protein